MNRSSFDNQQVSILTTLSLDGIDLSHFDCSSCRRSRSPRSRRSPSANAPSRSRTSRFSSRGTPRCSRSTSPSASPRPRCVHGRAPAVYAPLRDAGLPAPLSRGWCVPRLARGRGGVGRRGGYAGGGGGGWRGGETQVDVYLEETAPPGVVGRCECEISSRTRRQACSRLCVSPDYLSRTVPPCAESRLRRRTRSCGFGRFQSVRGGARLSLCVVRPCKVRWSDGDSGRYCVPFAGLAEA
ncbi:hypothetical protein B0H10DRAFT_1331884 [Mycena sp. CBHHK59/15]|nr:hypothetical protein B0H10DRAFT_1331884 [Mycena sp. CBHHK59/15]